MSKETRTVEAVGGVVKIKVSGEFSADHAKELAREIADAGHTAAGQYVDLLHEHGPVPPLTGGTADKEAEAAIERPGSVAAANAMNEMTAKEKAALVKQQQDEEKAAQEAQAQQDAEIAAAAARSEAAVTAETEAAPPEEEVVTPTAGKTPAKKAPAKTKAGTKK